MAGFDADYIPGWDCHGLPIEWKIEEEYREAGRDKDAVPVLQFRAECRAYAEHWMEVQRQEFRRLGVEGDWANRYATMDFPSEAAIAGEIGKFLLNGALYRGLRPVLWSPVEKTALAEAEVEYHDHTSTTIWVRFPVTASPVAGARGRVGGDLDHDALDHSRQPRHRGRRRRSTTRWCTWTASRRARSRASARSCWSRSPCCRRCWRTRASPRITSCTCFKGAELAGTVLAHPLARPRLRAGHAAADGRLRDHRGGHRLRASSRPITARTISRSAARTASRSGETVGDDGTFNPRVPLFAGLHVYKAADPVCAALAEAGGLLARGKLVHSYPHSWRSKAPLIFRATPQWFIRMDGPERIRETALDAIADDAFRAGAGPQPHRLDGRHPPRLVHQPPARLGRADRRVRREAHRRAAARPGGGARASSRRSRRRARIAGTPRRRRAFSATTGTRTITSR